MIAWERGPGRRTRRRGPGWPALAVLATLLACACEPRPGKVLETWETTNGSLTVRVTVQAEGNPAHFLEPGSHVKFESSPAGSSRWVTITRAYLKKRVPVPRDHVRLVTDKFGYVYFQWWTSVTTDGGRSWSVFDVPAHFPGRVRYRPELVRSVEIGADGRGAMDLDPAALPPGGPRVLHTKDFGRSWTE